MGVYGGFIAQIAKIKEVSSGEIRQCPISDSIWEDEDGLNFYMWEEGNYSCDCNRQLFFGRAKGTEPDWDSLYCSEDRFLVNIEIDGRVVYREFEEN